MLSNSLLLELNTILIEDYKMCLSRSEVTQIANSLVGIFELLVKMDFSENKQVTSSKYEHESPRSQLC